MKTKHRLETTALRALVIVLLMPCIAISASLPTDPLGGKPPAGSKQSVKDLDYQVKYQRAFEAVLWSMPAVGMYAYWHAAADWDAGPNTIIAWSKPATPYLEGVTGNNQTPYILSQTDLSKGPVVLEVPAATDKATLYGQVVDHWQISIADVGPSGLDKGRGGNILFTPPGYKGKVPAGYMEVKSPSYRITFAFRSIKSASGTTEDAYAYSKTIKMYYFSELPNPAPTKFVDPAGTGKRWAALPHFDERWFEDLYAIFSVENAKPTDTYMMGMLESLGIEKGKPYQPDAKTKKAMRQAVADAYFYMQEKFMEMRTSIAWWPDRNWADSMYTDQDRGFRFEKHDDTHHSMQIDPRAVHYFYGIYWPNKLSKQPATQYLMAMADKDGNELQAGKSYKLTVPKDVPVKQFWSLIVYDMETYSFIYSPQMRPGLSTFDMANMKKNEDGGVTIYFGPKAPPGLESNWIPTAGKKPFPIMRFYGGTEAFWDKSWKMPDVELVK
jgi:hypothetical protein